MGMNRAERRRFERAVRKGHVQLAPAAPASGAEVVAQRPGQRLERTPGGLLAVRYEPRP